LLFGRQRDLLSAMTTKEIADRLVSLCRDGKNMQAMEELYSPDIVSMEAMDMPNQGRTSTGMAAVKAKSEWWISNHEIHSMGVGDPFISLDAFVVQFDIDVTFKPTGKRHQMSEVGFYRVEGGKVVREEFLYKM
jgi:hypothetical protein